MSRFVARVKPIIAILYYAINIGALAFLYYGITLWIYIWLADRDLLRTYVWNIALIVVLLIVDRVLGSTVYSARWIRRSSQKGWGKVFTGYLFATGFASTKPALYLFYLVALVISRVAALAPAAFGSELVRYFTTIEGGLILIVVFDKLIELVVTDFRHTAGLTSMAAGVFRGRSDSTVATHGSTGRPTS